MAFYERFLERCKALGVKKTTIVLKAGASKGNLSRWKNGSIPNGRTLTRLAEQLECTVNDLLEGKSAQKDSGSDEPREKGESIAMPEKSFVERVAQLLDARDKDFRWLESKIGISYSRIKTFSDNHTIGKEFAIRASGRKLALSVDDIGNIAFCFGVSDDYLLGDASDDERICLLCAHELGDILRTATPDGGYKHKCPNCGTYEVTSDFILEFAGNVDVLDKKYLLSGWSRQFGDTDHPVVFTANKAKDVLSNPLTPRSAEAKISRLLGYCYENISLEDSTVEIKHPAVCYAKDKNELQLIINAVKDKGILEWVYDNYHRFSGSSAVELDA
jgi:transcriptional regulator with XRE-family HTH domain